MNEMKSLFEAASVFVLPSLSEGQAGVVIEALSMGCPVVITRECGVDIEDGKQGFIIPIKNSQAIAEKIELIFNDTELRKSMQINALEFSQEFNESKWTNRLKALNHFLF